jgi:hypothetical protein
VSATLRFAEEGRLAPGSDGEQALVCLARILERARVHVDAEAAAVDLARAEMDEVVCDGTPPSLTDAASACKDGSVSRNTNTGLVIRP